MSRIPPSAGRRPRLGVELLEPRDVPALLPGAQLAVGSDAGAPPLVRLVDADTQIEQAQFLAFEGNFTGGVRVAVGDVVGNGYPDLVVAAGPGGGPVVKVYDGRTGALRSTFLVFQNSFTGGVNVATGDVDGDGRDEVIVGSGAGGGPQVGVWDAATGTQKLAFFAYDPSFRGGVRVAAADTNGDGRAEVVTAPGFSGGPHVKVFDLADGVNQVGSFFAYGQSFTGGAYVAAGDVNGDGRAEVVTGTGPTGGPQVSVFTADGRQLTSFFAYSTDFLGGVRVAVANLTGDGAAEIVTTPGPGGAAQTNVYTFPSDSLASMFTFNTDQTTGFFPAASPVRLNLPSTPADEIEAAYEPLRQAELARRAELARLAAQPRSPTQVVVVNQNVNTLPWWYWGPGFGLGYGLGFGPWYGLGYGLGFGGFAPAFYDAPGLYTPLDPFYDPGFFAEPVVFSDPAFYDPGFYDPGFYDPGFYDMGFYDPGYYDPGGYFVDPGFYDPGFFGGGFFDGGGFFGF